MNEILLRAASEPARAAQVPRTFDARALAHAITNAEQAQMWAIKAKVTE